MAQPTSHNSRSICKTFVSWTRRALTYGGVWLAYDSNTKNSLLTALRQAIAPRHAYMVHLGSGCGRANTLQKDPWPQHNTIQVKSRQNSCCRSSLRVVYTYLLVRDLTGREAPTPSAIGDFPRRRPAIYRDRCGVKIRVVGNLDGKMVFL